MCSFLEAGLSMEIPDPQKEEHILLEVVLNACAPDWTCTTGDEPQAPAQPKKMLLYMLILPSLLQVAAH